MTVKQEEQLKFKITDYRRFAFILVALAGFLALGTVLPGESVPAVHTGWILGGVTILLIIAVIMNGVAVKTAQELYENEEKE